MPKQLSTPAWPTEQLARLYQGRINFTSYPTLARQLRRSEQELKDKWAEREQWQARFVSPVDRDAREDEKAKALKAINDRWDARVDLQRLRSEIIADRMAEKIVPLSPAELPVYRPSKLKGVRTSSPEDAILVLSDMHIGQKFTMEETGNLGEYSMEIFDRRLETLRNGVTRITELHSSLYPMPVLNIFLLGDNVHGASEVGKWGAAYSEATIFDQVQYGQRQLVGTINYFLGLYKEIHLFCVYGNHGRTANKGVEKDYVNYDMFLYGSLDSYFREEPRVKVVAKKQWFLNTVIRNHRFYLLHGDDVKGGNCPVNSLAKTEQKYVSLLGKGGTLPDYTICGHFHNSAELGTSHGRCYVNGAFTGPDPHSLKAMQVGGRPEQLFLGVHDERGITWKYNIDLDKR